MADGGARCTDKCTPVTKLPFIVGTRSSIIAGKIYDIVFAQRRFISRDISTNDRADDDRFGDLQGAVAKDGHQFDGIGSCRQVDDRVHRLITVFVITEIPNEITGVTRRYLLEDHF